MLRTTLAHTCRTLGALVPAHTFTHTHAHPRAERHTGAHPRPAEHAPKYRTHAWTFTQARPSPNVKSATLWDEAVCDQGLRTHGSAWIPEKRAGRPQSPLSASCTCEAPLTFGTYRSRGSFQAPLPGPSWLPHGACLAWKPVFPGGPRGPGPALRCLHVHGGHLGQQVGEFGCGAGTQRHTLKQG